ncbi:hypothetical protein GCM10009821_14850 [Aeromicrobium halocynthiae]|uniref:DNA-3-methyladenine glycosylase II n=1 Tax=Aeromicrobium halocynthiae TaxID=560557 RepID=A0ABN2W1L1_9ACTN
MTGPRSQTRLPVPQPFAAGELLTFLAAHVVPGVEDVAGTVVTSTVAAPGGPAVVRMDVADRHVDVRWEATDAVDGLWLLARVEELLDLHVDPVAIDTALSTDPLLAPLVEQRPGLRVPGTLDVGATAVRTVVGQQISVTGAATVLGRMAAEHGQRCGLPLARQAGLDRLFPSAETLAEVDPETLPMPRSRGRTVVGLAAALADGRVRLGPREDRADVRRDLLALHGVGPWTADYVLMRGTGDPDVLLTTDLVLRRGLERRGLAPAATARWSPWRSYAGMHLWLADVPALARGEDHR